MSDCTRVILVMCNARAFSQVYHTLHTLRGSAQLSSPYLASRCVKPTSLVMNEGGWNEGWNEEDGVQLFNQNFTPNLSILTRGAPIIFAGRCLAEHMFIWSMVIKLTTWRIPQIKLSDVSKLVSGVEQERVQKQRRGWVPRCDSLSQVAISVRFKVIPNDLTQWRGRWWTSQSAQTGFIKDLGPELWQRSEFSVQASTCWWGRWGSQQSALNQAWINLSTNLVVRMHSHEPRVRKNIDPVPDKGRGPRQLEESSPRLSQRRNILEGRTPWLQCQGWGGVYDFRSAVPATPPNAFVGWSFWSLCLARLLRVLGEGCSLPTTATVTSIAQPLELIQ